MTAPTSAMFAEADMIAFASVYDPQPMHIDPLAANEGPLGGLTASGWHTAAMVMRLIVAANPLDGAPLLGLGVEDLRWPNPVRPGDAISVELEVVATTPSRSKPTHGVVQLRVTARNQHQQVVLIMSPKLWVQRRTER